MKAPDRRGSGEWIAIGVSPRTRTIARPALPFENASRTAASLARSNVITVPVRSRRRAAPEPLRRRIVLRTAGRVGRPSRRRDGRWASAVSTPSLTLTRAMIVRSCVDVLDRSDRRPSSTRSSRTSRSESHRAAVLPSSRRRLMLPTVPLSFGKSGKPRLACAFDSIDQDRRAVWPARVEPEGVPQIGARDRARSSGVPARHRDRCGSCPSW